MAQFVEDILFKDWSAFYVSVDDSVLVFKPRVETVSRDLTSCLPFSDLAIGAFCQRWRFSSNNMRGIIPIGAMVNSHILSNYD